MSSDIILFFFSYILIIYSVIGYGLLGDVIGFFILCCGAGLLHECCCKEDSSDDW